MSVTQSSSYANRTDHRLILILEPWAEEFWVESGEQVDIEARGGVPGGRFELVHRTDGLTVYGWEGALVYVLRDGKELAPSPQVQCWRSEHRIGVGLQFALNSMAHMVEIDAHAFAPRKLECGHHVTVSRNNDNDVHKLAQG